MIEAKTQRKMKTNPTAAKQTWSCFGVEQCELGAIQPYSGDRGSVSIDGCSAT